jgi:hypothetical protein
LPKSKIQKGILVCQRLLIKRYKVRMCVIACPCLLLKPLTEIGSLSQVALISKNLAVLIAYAVLIKANPFTLVLARACKSTLYLL